MNSYLVLIVLGERTAFYPFPQFYEGVEIRPSKFDDDNEKEALASSAKESNVDVDKLEVSPRLAVLVKSDDHINAVIEAKKKFSVVLDLLSAESPLSSFSLSTVGFVKDLANGNITPMQGPGFTFNTSFYMNRGRLQKYDQTAYILKNSSELSDRYLKSLHWRRSSKNESDSQLKILFDYFSAEALFKENETENIGGILRWFLGFPNGPSGKLVAKEKIFEIENHKSYMLLSKLLVKKFDSLRELRNNSVHAGFRPMDFSDFDLELFETILIYAVNRAQLSVRWAILNGFKTIKELKEYMPVVFEEIVNVNDVHNNIIFGLEQLIYRDKSDVNYLS